MKDDSDVITLEMMRQALYTAVVCDVLDSLGFPRQSPPVSLQPLAGDVVLIGRAKTTLWSEMAEPDPSPYELELEAVDACQPDDVFIAAAGGSTRSGIWGELYRPPHETAAAAARSSTVACATSPKCEKCGFPCSPEGSRLMTARIASA